MKIAGIVAEYNPFHKGHALHIERTRAPGGGSPPVGGPPPVGGGATHVVAVMSGSFVQRGEPALLPKADRVRAALLGGVDLVLELPLPWALSSAEGFAFGAVSILESLGCVDMLSFGSECGDAQRLERVVSVMEEERFSSLLRYHLDHGISFPEARQRTVKELAGEKTAALLESPNNTLGIEYIKALRRLSSAMTPYTIRRLGAGHDEERPVGDVASASYIRRLYRAGRVIDAAAYQPRGVCPVVDEALRAGRCPAEEERLERAVLARLRTLTAQELAALPGVSEGLENRLYEGVRRAGSLPQLYGLIKTKRYPLTRLRRLVWSAFLGVPAGWERQAPPYIRVLGAGPGGREILTAAKQARRERGGLPPLVSRAAQFEQLDDRCRALFALECRATDLYALSLPTPPPCGVECTTGMIKQGWD